MMMMIMIMMMIVKEMILTMMMILTGRWVGWLCQSVAVAEFAAQCPRIDFRWRRRRIYIHRHLFHYFSCSFRVLYFSIDAETL